MPKKPVDYSKTIIYRIVCKNPEIKECYVGSTTDVKSRKQNHKHYCNNETSKKYNFNVYNFIRSNGNWENFSMLEIERYNAIDKPDQAKRERHWLEFYNATLNSQVPSRTRKEYKDKIITCCCGAKLTKHHQSRHEKSKKHIKFLEPKVALLEQNK